MNGNRCPKCGSQGNCYCRSLNGFSLYVLSYEYIFVCPKCGRKEKIIESLPFKIWGTLQLFSCCPFCGKNQKEHSKTLPGLGQKE